MSRSGESASNSKHLKDAGLVLLALNGLALASSDLLYVIVGSFGMFLGLPLGGLSWGLIWIGLLAAVVYSMDYLDPVGRYLWARANLTKTAPLQRRLVIASIALALVVATINIGLWAQASQTPTTTRTLRLCYADDLVEGSTRVIGSLMGHGHPAPNRDPCDGLYPPRLAAWLPLMIALGLVAALLLALLDCEEREREQARLKARLAVPQNPSPAHAGPEPLVHQPGVTRGISAIEALPAVRPSERTIELVRALNVKSKPVRSTGSDWLMPLRRWPVLCAGMGSYALGWLLELAGSDLPTRIAIVLAPAPLVQQHGGWPLLGIWASGCFALALALIYALLRR